MKKIFKEDIKDNMRKIYEQFILQLLSDGINTVEFKKFIDRYKIELYNENYSIHETIHNNLNK